LTRVRAAGQRVREEVLPALLELGRARSDLSDAILPVLGHRGKWLAAQNSDWDAIFGFEDGSVWERGSLEQRRAFLTLLRRRDPARARQLLLGVWEQESPKNRADFLAILAHGLSPDDELFLESALDDKWTIVRRAAAELLSSLPESAFVERMSERAKRLISFQNNARGRFEIEILLPEERDEGMMRDGIVKVPPHSQIGEKAWWLQQILSAVPPSFWLQSAQRTVNDLLKIAKKSEWSQVLLNGWCRAAISFGDVEWIECLLEVSSNYMPAEDLFAALPPDRQEAMVGRLLRKDSTWSSFNQLYWFFKSCRHQWSEHFSSEVVRGLSKHHEKYVLKNDIVLRNIITMIVCHLHPLIIPEAISGLNKVTRQITKRAPMLDHFLDMIQFRNEMLKEIEK
ncbi:MAG: DUF5691 domain-containing protein, partial [Acidobacteria bacterium]|nr:DUF5691 domain-containing protein [Acidobacteriota bacterium]